MKETITPMTFEELKARLEKVQQAILSIQANPNIAKPSQVKTLEKHLIQLQESLQKKINLILEMDKGVIHTDDENKAKELAKQGVQVHLQKKGEPLDTKKIKEAEEGLQFDANQTKEIAKEVAKAVAMALKEDGMEIASAKILRLEPMAFDTFFQYKDGKEDEFAFHIDQNKNIVLSDFTFTEIIGQVGVKGAGEPFVNKDVVKANLLKVWAKLDGNMQEGEGEEDLMQQLEKALQSHDWYYMMSDDHRWYTRGSEQARNIRNLIVKLKDAGKGDEAEALYKSYSDKNKFEGVTEASVGSIQKKHGELVAKMKALAAKYKGGDQSVVPELKALTAEKKKLEAELDAAVAGTGKDQELDTSVNEYEHSYRLVGGECRKYNDEGEYTVVSMSYCRYNEGKDFDKDGKVEKPEAEYKGVKDKAIKKAMGKTEAKKAKKDFDKDGDVESPEAEYKGVKDKAVKKAMLKKEEVDSSKIYGASSRNQGDTGSSLQFTIIEDTPEYFEIDYIITPNSKYRPAGAGSRSPREKEYGYAKISKADFDGEIIVKGERYNLGRDFIKNNLEGGQTVPNENKKAVVKEDWGSSDQGIMNRSIHKDLGEPEEMPMPFDNDFESAIEDAVDFYWNEWEEYQSDRDGLIDHAKRAYYRAYFPEKFAGFQKMFSEAAEQSYADLETIANDTAKMPAERDAARNKMYDLKKKKAGAKLAEAPNYSLQDEVQELIEDMDLEEYENFAYDNDIDPDDANEMQNFITSLSDAEAQKILIQYGNKKFYIKVAIRDAKRALELINDNPAYSKAVEIDGSDTYYLTNPGLAYDLQMDFGTQDIEVIDSNVDMNEVKGETELVQDPKTKEFTRRMKMTPKDMETIGKVQAMMAKEKSMKKEGQEDDVAVDITGKAYSIGDIIEFRGHKFECQIGQRGIVVLQKVDDQLNPLPQFFEGGTPQFTAILKNAKIVSDNRGGIAEGGVNPEGDAMVLNFIKKLAKIWDIPMQHAVNFIHASIKRQGY